MNSWVTNEKKARMNNDIITQKHFHTQAVIKWKQEKKNFLSHLTNCSILKKNSNVHLLIFLFPHFEYICLVISLSRIRCMCTQ